jgi:uncharacterized Rossmann fold enzyme
MTSKHTPGPWIYSRWWDQFQWDMSDDDERADLLKAPIIRIETTDGVTVTCCHDLASIREADARLIAAAPDLLAALEALLSYDDMVECADMARAAIAKARGE